MGKDEVIHLPPDDQPKLPEKINNFKASIASEEGLRDDPIIQAEYLWELKGLWKELTDRSRNELMKLVAPYLPRLDHSTSPRDLLKQVIFLSSQEDIQRALLWDPNQIPFYEVEAEERIYEDVTGWLAVYMEWSKHNKVPLGFHFWSGVAALTSGCRRNFYIERQSYRIWMNMFIILTGKKDAGKSFAWEIGLDVIYRLNAHFPMELVAERRYRIPIFPEDVTQEYLVEALSELNEPTPVKSRITGEVKMLPGDAAAVITCDELSNLLGKSTNNAGKKTPFLVSACYRER